MATQTTIPASFFGMVLGLSGLGQAWRVAVKLWYMPEWIGESILVLASVVWLSLLVLYLRQAIQRPAQVRQEFLHPVQGSTPALLAVSTLLIGMAAFRYSDIIGSILITFGIGWHLLFSLWHTGAQWQGKRQFIDTTPALYLPTVAGNFVSGAALGVMGFAPWGWLFLGAGFFSWLSIESLMIKRLWLDNSLPAMQRPLMGIQFAPPVVCLMAALNLTQDLTSPLLLMLWGYGLYQLMIGVRLSRWLGEQAFSPAYWSYTFGIAATTVSTLKLALAGSQPAMILAVPIFVLANAFIGVLAIRTTNLLFGAQSKK